MLFLRQLESFINVTRIKEVRCYFRSWKIHGVLNAVILLIRIRNEIDTVSICQDLIIQSRASCRLTNNYPAVISAPRLAELKIQHSPQVPQYLLWVEF